MQQNLPNDAILKAELFKPTDRQLVRYFNLLNAAIFDKKLQRPVLKISKMRSMWGYCSVLNDDPLHPRTKIVVNANYPCKQFFIATLAHEMVHQYQWEVLAQRHARLALRKRRARRGRIPSMSHGPSFVQWRYKFKKCGIPLFVTAGSKQVMAAIRRYNS